MIQPYYEDAAVTLYHGDCLDILPQLEPVDHVITDPPYEVEAHTNARRLNAQHDIRDYVIEFSAITEEVRERFTAECGRLSRGWVLVFCQSEAIGSWRRALETGGCAWKRAQAWVKPDSAPQFTGDRPAVGFECIATAWAGSGKSKWNGGGKRGVYEHCVNNFGRLTAGRPHPTMKPLPLMTELVTLFTDQGETILDPFAGSGTTGVAAKLNGRKAILIEREGKYCEIAAKRLRETEPGRLFDKAPRAKPRRLLDVSAEI